MTGLLGDAAARLHCRDLPQKACDVGKRVEHLQSVREYTVMAVVLLIGTVIWELRFARTGIFGRRSYWVSMAIVAFFQVLSDGWLTKLSAPIVIYDRSEFSGIRFPFDIPIEDFAFGFALVTMAIIGWERQRPTVPNGGPPRN